MNLKEILLVSGVVVVGAVLLLSVPDPHKFTEGGNHPAIVEAQETQYFTEDALNTKIDTQGVVTVTVVLPEFSSNTKEWKFDVGLNTHSLELDQDMTEVAVLVDDSGKEYKPLSWEGAGPGGHHREGVLTFKSIIPTPKSVELRIINVGAPVRSFVWNIIN